MEEQKSLSDDLSKIPGLRKLFNHQKTWTPLWYPSKDYVNQKIVRIEINPQTKMTKNRGQKTKKKNNEFTLLHNAGATCFMVCEAKYRVRTAMFQKIYNDHNAKTNKHFLNMMFAMSDKIAKQSAEIQSLIPELQALKNTNDDMLDWEQQQDAFEMCDYILNKMHVCIRVKSNVTDFERWKKNNETMNDFVARRINGYWLADETSTINEYRAIWKAVTDTREECENEKTELIMDKNIILSTQQNTNYVSYAFLNVDGSETGRCGTVTVSNKIIEENHWLDLLNAIVHTRDKNVNIDTKNINHEKFKIKGELYIYFIAGGTLGYDGNVGSSLIEGAATKPTIQTMTQNNLVVVIQQCPKNYSFSVPLSISSVREDEECRAPMIIPFRMFFDQQSDLECIIKKIFEHIDIKCNIPFDIPANSPWYSIDYESGWSKWEQFGGTKYPQMNSTAKAKVLDALKTTTNVLIRIECDLKYQWQPPATKVSFAEVLANHFAPEEVYKGALGQRQLWQRSYQIMAPLPATLLIFIGRNMIDPITGQTMKNNEIVQLEGMKFKLPNTECMDNVYKITGTLSHSGTVTQGHYVCYVPIPNTSKFVKVNDDKLTFNQTLINASTDVCAIFAEKTAKKQNIPTQQNQQECSKNQKK